jgi:hypothetical protein
MSSRWALGTTALAAALAFSDIDAVLPDPICGVVIVASVIWAMGVAALSWPDPR